MSTFSNWVNLPPPPPSPSRGPESRKECDVSQSSVPAWMSCLPDLKYIHFSDISDSLIDCWSCSQSQRSPAGTSGCPSEVSVSLESDMLLGSLWFCCCCKLHALLCNNMICFLNVCHSLWVSTTETTQGDHIPPYNVPNPPTHSHCRPTLQLCH